MEKNSPLTKILDETNFIQLKYDQNTFSMDVSSINFDNPSSILYSWKLKGFYDQWTPPTSNGTIRYTNLSPGNYTLKVRSILLDNQQILEEREIQILVERPFWLTFWAFLIYALFIIGAAYAFLRYQIIKRERKTSEEKINFFTHAAHDIRTPLTMIKAPLSEIMEKESLSENGQKNIQLAMQSTENLAELANNLINFQKEELYSSQTIVTAHELNHYLSNYMHQFDSFARQKDITLSYESSFDSLDVWIDTSKMDSILRNLLSNALKYTPQGGRVSLKAESNKNTWTLFLSDTGIGMNKEDQKKLFKYLFRGYNTANQTTTGCGIGMLLTYRLIENHEGKISFTSTENVGTTFQLTFPIRSKNYQYKKEEKEGTDKVLTTEQETAGNITTDIQFTDSQTDEQAPLILVVEDNAPLRSFIIHSLSDTSQVEGAGNGQEALDFINERQPDLILSDIMMPVMDGKKMCQIVKSQMETSHIPIILLTALGDKEHILEGLEIKADQYLVKPFDVHILKATIRTLIANRKMLRNRFKSAVTALPEEAPAVELPTSLDDEFIQKVTELVKEGLGKNFNVDTLCASVNMSRTSFYNKIKALTGIAPAEFIRNIRMQEAALMLKSQRYTVAEVSDKMGFADPKYFTDTFKKFYGVPPSIYMKKN
ncbi:hybrid sensor histidine kinase/response regulator transcription factor [Phocaeicola plebeius]